MYRDLQSLLADYADGPQQLSARVHELSAADSDARPVPERWTIREVVCHLSDFEIVSADRIRRVLAEDNPTFFDGDPRLFAAALKYDQRSVAEELTLIEAVRTSTARILGGCDLEDLQRTGVHSAEGPMTLETLVERTVKHIPHHLVFIEEKLAALAGDGT